MTIMIIDEKTIINNNVTINYPKIEISYSAYHNAWYAQLIKNNNIELYEDINEAYSYPYSDVRGKYCALDKLIKRLYRNNLISADNKNSLLNDIG